MGKRLYTDVAAARHMSSGTLRGSRTEGDLVRSDLVRPAGSSKPEPATSYRRKRAVAVALSLCVFISVPALITLLVLFG